MRKKGKNRGWLDYRYPVDLAQGRERLGDLYFQCFWYKSTRTDRIYTFNHVDLVQVHVHEVICPVIMTYQDDTDKYLAELDGLQVLKKAVRGAVDIQLE